MSPYQFLSQLNSIPRPGGDGVLVERTLTLPGDLRTVAGLVLTAGTAPAVILTETNGLTIVAAASSNLAGSFTFQVPQDYDKTADVLKIAVVAGMDGATNVPVMDATIYSKRPGEDLSADLNPTPSAALAPASAEVEIDVSGKDLEPGDILTINLVTGAHTTDNVSIHSVSVRYKSSIVFADPASR